MHRRRWTFAPIAALAFTMLAPHGASGQAGPDSLKVDTAGGVVRSYDLRGVTVRVARPGLTTGGSSAVTVEMDSVAHLPAPTVEQVLRAMPLVQIRANSRGEAQPAIRGSGDRQIAVLVDGVPLTLGWDHRTDLSIIPLTAAREVTLLRGLSSVLYGPNVLGGVVRIDVARQRGRALRPDPMTVGFGLDQTGSTSLSATGGRIVETASGEWALRSGLGFNHRRGAELASGVDREHGIRSRYLGDPADGLRLNSDARRIDGFVSALYRSDGGGWASLAATGYDVERGVPPEAHVDEPRLWRYPFERRFFTALSVGTPQARTGWGTGDLEASLGLDLGDMRIDRFRSERYGTVVGREDGSDRTLTLRILGEHSVGDAGALRSSFTYADITHDEVLDDTDAARYRQRLWSWGAETEWGLGPEAHTRVVGGLAVDGADTPESGGKPPLGALRNWGLRLGASSLMGGGAVLIHGSVSRRVRFPSLRELYSGALGRFLPNPALRPEVLLGGEAGLTVSGDRGQFQAVTFHQRLTDGIIRRSVVTAQGKKFQRINQSRVRSTGLEMLGVASLGSTTWTGDVTVQRVRGIEPDGSEVQLEYEPGVIGHLGVRLEPVAGVRSSVDFRYTSAQRCENPEVGGLDPLRSSRVVDLGVRRVFSGSRSGRLRRVDVSLNVTNVADAVVWDQCGLPQPGRTVMLQLRVW